MSDLLIKAGRIYDGVSDKAMPDGFVHVQKDAILAVGSLADIGADEQSRFGSIVELGAEATVLPGLINMHVHMANSCGANFVEDALADTEIMATARAVDNLYKALLSGTTTVRDCGTRTPVAMTVKHAIAQGAVRGPNIVTCGLGLTKAGGHFWYSSYEVDDRESALRAIHEQIAAGADFIKLFVTGGRYLEPGKTPWQPQFATKDFFAMVEETHRLKKPVVCHCHGTEGIRHAVEAGVQGIEHCTFLGPRGIGYEPALAAAIAERGIVVCPTIFRGIAKFSKAEDYLPGSPERMYFEYTPLWFDSLRKMAAQGVRIISGNDAGSPFIEFSDFPGDLAFQAKGMGWSPLQALQSATSQAAAVLGRDDLGRIKPGLKADLLGVWGNPLDNLWDLEKTALVIARGTQVTPPRFESTAGSG